MNYKKRIKELDSYIFEVDDKGSECITMLLDRIERLERIVHQLQTKPVITPCSHPVDFKQMVKDENELISNTATSSVNIKPKHTSVYPEIK